MSFIVVDDQQAKLISESSGRVEVRDASGRCLGYVVQGTAIHRGFTDEEIAAARERLASSEARYTTAQVVEFLRALEAK